MFGLSPFELLIVFAVALIVLGPDKLPGFARSIGRGLRDLQRALQGIDLEEDPPRRDESARFDPLAGPRKPAGPAESAGSADPDASVPNEAPQAESGPDAGREPEP